MQERTGNPETGQQEGVSREDSGTDTGGRGEEGRGPLDSWVETGGARRRRRAGRERCLGAWGSRDRARVASAARSSLLAHGPACLIIAGIGVIFALNYFHFAQRFPLVS